MDRIVRARIRGREWLLNYSMDTMFRVTEKFGGTNEALDAMQKPNKEGFDAVCWMAVTLAEDAELLRRELGYEYREMVTMESLSKRMIPADFLSLREAVTAAIVYGYKRELPQTKREDAEIDLGLMELEEAKKAPAGE